MKNKISFEEVKRLALKAIGESETTFEMIECLIQRVYQEGYTNGIKEGVRLTEECYKAYADAGYDFRNYINLF